MVSYCCVGVDDVLGLHIHPCSYVSRRQNYATFMDEVLRKKVRVNSQKIVDKISLLSRVSNTADVTYLSSGNHHIFCDWFAKFCLILPLGLIEEADQVLL
jgi:hypothetical protein